MSTSHKVANIICGEAMKKLRKAISMTQAELADRLGVSWRTVAGWEAGSSYPRTEHFKELIALAVQQQAFTVWHEAEEIRILWKVAHQKTLLDERWLCALLDQWCCPQGQALRLQVEPEAVEEAMTTASARTTGATPPLLGESLPQTPSQTSADQSQRSLSVEIGAEPRMAIEAVGNVGSSQGPVGSRTGASPVPTAPVRPRLWPLSDGDGPRPATEKTRRRRKWLIGTLITLIILAIIGSAGTLFFSARGQATDLTYPGYLLGNGRLSFFDPLSQKEESEWALHSTNSTGGLCQFIGGSYHVSQQQTAYFGWCPVNETFDNFAFEVQLTITQGDCGGLIFWQDDMGQFYKFIICENRFYGVSKFMNNRKAVTLQESYSSAIRAGLDQQNKIAVVAAGRSMTFYVNEQQIDQERDSSYTWEKIALIANPYYPNGGHATDIAYSNARVWTL